MWINVAVALPYRLPARLGVADGNTRVVIISFTAAVNTTDLIADLRPICQLLQTSNSGSYNSSVAKGRAIELTAGIHIFQTSFLSEGYQPVCTLLYHCSTATEYSSTCHPSPFPPFAECIITDCK
jgi:hypothetical protein